MVKCLECGKPCRDEAQLHRHLKAHKMSQGNYYVKHFPRYDKLDGTPIIFKNRDWYFNADFNSRGNLKDWLDRVEPDVAKAYVRKLLLTRKEKRKLIYSPCQVELRSLPMPGMVYMNRLFGDYYEECHNLGFVNRFSQMSFNGIWKEFEPYHRIIVDTREQLPLVFDNIKTVHKGLPFADYKLNDDEFSRKVCIERKSMGDLFYTMSSGHIRFYHEILKAQDAGFYMVVVVEEPFTQVYVQSQRLKNLDIVCSPEYVLHNIREFIQKFDMLQFLFVDSREEASLVITKLLQSNGQCRYVDLQYAYDTGNFFGICGNLK